MFKKGLLTELAQRRDEIRGWLRTEAPETSREQAHLNAGSMERAYWNHGYQAALDDIMSILNAPRADGTSGTASH